MSRKKKIVLSAAVCLAVLLIGGLIWGGNYLVTFAIARSTGLKDIVPESTLSEEATRGIIQTWQQQARQAQDWMAQSAVETAQIQSADGLRLSGEAVVTDPGALHRVPLLHGGVPQKHRHTGLLWPIEPACRYRAKIQNVLSAVRHEPRPGLRLPAMRPLRKKLPPAHSHPGCAEGICRAVRAGRRGVIPDR